MDFRILKKKFRLLGTFTEIFTIFRLLVRNFRLLAFRFPYTEFPDSVTEFRLLGTAPKSIPFVSYKAGDKEIYIYIYFIKAN